jgi:hypothetical protein
MPTYRQRDWLDTDMVAPEAMMPPGATALLTNWPAWLIGISRRVRFLTKLHRDFFISTRSATPFAATDRPHVCELKYTQSPFTAILSRYLPVVSRIVWHTTPPARAAVLVRSGFGDHRQCPGSCPPERSGTYASRWCELIDCLGRKALTELERRSWLWPPSVHNALRRATLLLRAKRPVSARQQRFLLS